MPSTFGRDEEITVMTNLKGVFLIVFETPQRKFSVMTTV
jgi:hypothetical protein